MRHIFYNGKVYTADPRRPHATGVVVENDRIVFVGSAEDALNAKKPTDNLIDLGGRSLLPGMNDSHMHLLSVGMALLAVDLTELDSIAALQDRVRQKAEQLPPGEWVLGRGWDQNRYREGRYPTRHDLDAVAPHNPVVLTRACGHALVANTKAFELAGIDASTPEVSGGQIDREASGYPAGVLREKAMGLVRAGIPTPDAAAVSRTVTMAAEHAASRGITSVQTNDGGGSSWIGVWEAYRQALLRDELPVRVNLHFTLGAEDLKRDQEALYAANMGVPSDRLQFGAVKIMADGSLGARTAAFFEDYSDDSGNRGITLYAQEDLDELVKTAHQMGYPVAVHAIGDRTADQAITAIERAQGLQTFRRHRLIHCQILSSHIINRMARAGMIADIQPKFLTTDWYWTESRVGQERLSYSYAWKSLMDFGVACAGGSDAPVEVVDPLLGIFAAVTRTDLEGNPQGGWLPEQKLSLYQALDIFTAGSAYAEHQEQIKGRIAPGLKADLIILSGDIETSEPATIKDLAVDMTMMDGRIVYTK